MREVGSWSRRRLRTKIIRTIHTPHLSSLSIVHHDEQVVFIVVGHGAHLYSPIHNLRYWLAFILYTQSFAVALCQKLTRFKLSQTCRSSAQSTCTVTRNQETRRIFPSILVRSYPTSHAEEVSDSEQNDDMLCHLAMQAGVASVSCGRPWPSCSERHQMLSA